MENASKALIMAGGILVGVIIMSIGAYLFSVFGSTSKEIQEQVDSRVVAEFNNNFTKYEGSSSITIHDIVSMANLAKKNNTDYNLTYADKDNEYYVEVYLKDPTVAASQRELTTVDDYTEIIQQCSVVTSVNAEGKTEANIKYYTCVIETNSQEDNTRVKKITFTPVS